MVDHSAQNPKNEGLNPSTGTGKETLMKKMSKSKKREFSIKFECKQAPPLQKKYYTWREVGGRLFVPSKLHQHRVIREYEMGKYHCTVDLLFDWFGLVCFANINKNCQLSYS